MKEDITDIKNNYATVTSVNSDIDLLTSDLKNTKKLRTIVKKRA